jgi:hypothetical protein
MATASKLYLKFSGVTFTPTGGSALTIDKVTECDHGEVGQNIQFFGDGAQYPTANKVAHSAVGVSIKSGNKAALDAVPIGTVGTLVFIAQDARNGVGTGARTYTVTGAQLVSRPMTGSETNWGMGTLTFVSESSDGVTNPLSVAVAP